MRTAAPSPAELAADYRQVLQYCLTARVSTAASQQRIRERCMSFRSKVLISAACATIFLQVAPAGAQNQHNLILFVPDGLRALSVTPEIAPTLAALRDNGVNFANPHSLFPT